MKNARLLNKTTRSRPGRGQSFEAKAKILASRPLWPWGLNITGFNTSINLSSTTCVCRPVVLRVAQCRRLSTAAWTATCRHRQAPSTLKHPVSRRPVYTVPTAPITSSRVPTQCAFTPPSQTTSAIVSPICGAPTRSEIPATVIVHTSIASTRTMRTSGRRR